MSLRTFPLHPDTTIERYDPNPWFPGVVDESPKFVAAKSIFDDPLVGEAVRRLLAGTSTEEHVDGAIYYIASINYEGGRYEDGFGHFMVCRDCGARVGLIGDSDADEEGNDVITFALADRGGDMAGEDAWCSACVRASANDASVAADLIAISVAAAA